MKETKWKTLKSRRTKHKLILFYKMLHNLTPNFLSSLVPETVDSSSRYPLRNNDNFQLPHSRTNLYYNSFLPSVIRDFNSLPLETKQAPSLSIFKRRLSKDIRPPPKYFLHGDRKVQILHTKIRTNCSSLANDLFTKNITDSPFCQCGDIETASHFFLKCPRYLPQRALLSAEIAKLTTLTLNNILFGDSSLKNESNIHIFTSVHSYISATKRFADTV